MNPTFRLALLAPLLAWPAASAQDCPLVIDVNTHPAQLSSVESTPAYDLGQAPGGDLFFAARRPESGLEVWRTDGTIAGTQLAVDVAPGSASSNPRDFFAYNQRVYFSAFPTIWGTTALVVTDGSAAGTQSLPATNPREYLGAGHLVFFSATLTAHGRELWRTDGTKAGTVMLKDIAKGIWSSNPHNLTMLPSGTGFVFAADTKGDNGYELYMSDGTAPGTKRLKDLSLIKSDIKKDTRFAAFSGRLYFSGRDTVGTYTLWSTDGTEAGTQIFLTPQQSLVPNVDHEHFAVYQNELYLKAGDASTGPELWKTDGVNAQLVADITPGAQGSGPRAFTEFAGELFFFTFDGAHKLMAYDGASNGLRQVADLSAMMSGSAITPQDLQVFNGRLLFTTGSGMTGREWWTSDGTLMGTVELANFDGSAQSSIQGDLHQVAPNRGLIMAITPDSGRELHVTDGTQGGTSLLFEIIANATMNSSPRELKTVGGNQLYFSADSGQGQEPHRYALDGSLVQLADMNPRSESSWPRGFTPVVLRGRSEVLFSAFNKGVGEELMATDGTPAGTRMVADLVVGPTSSTPHSFTQVNDVVVFAATHPLSGEELWATDGTAAGTHMLLDVTPGGGSGFVGPLVSLGEVAVFVAESPAKGTELYATDGTIAGTQLIKDILVLIKDILVNAPSGNPKNLTRIGDEVYFFARHQAAIKDALWKTDGTAMGTTKLFDLGDVNVVHKGDILVMKDVLYFAASTPFNGRELWRSDLTQGGTFMLKDLSSGNLSSEFVAMAATRDRLFVSANATDTVLGTELYVTDGSPGNLNVVADLAAGPKSSGIDRIVPVGDVVYFAATNFDKLRELYRADANGIERLCEVSVGNEPDRTGSPSSSKVEELVLLGHDLYFVANQPQAAGRELFRFANPGAFSVDLETGGLMHLDVGTPILGSPLSIRLSGAPTTGVHVLVGSPALSSAMWFPALLPGQVTWVQPAAPLVFGTGTGSSVDFSMLVPNAPTLIGGRLNLQVGHFDPALPGPYELSNGVQLVFGN